MIQVIRWLPKSAILLLVLFQIVGSCKGQTDSIYTEIRYYGTGCLSVQRGETAILTDPYISNLSTLQVSLGKVKTDVNYVELYINPAALRKVKMVMVGHSHYNHLLDLPHLLRYIPSETPILLNHTGKHILAYYQLKHQLVVVNDIAGTERQLGYWYYGSDSTVRAMAFNSVHQPKLAGIGAQDRIYGSDISGEPILVSDWQAGKTYSYVIDFLNDGEVTYRMLFMSSGATAPNGMFPKSLLKEHSINDMFISASAKLEFDEYPRPLIDLCAPERIFLIHWERSGIHKEEQMKALDQNSLDILKAKLQENYGESIEVVVPMPLNYY